MQYYIRLTCISILAWLCFVPPILFAQTLDIKDDFFSAQNYQLDEIWRALKAGKNINPDLLFDTQDKIRLFSDNMKQCVANETSELNSLKNVFAKSDQLVNIGNDTESYNLLLLQSKAHEKRLLDCSFLARVLKVQMITAQSLTRYMPRSSFFDRTLPAWKIQPAIVSEEIKRISFRFFYLHSGLDKISLLQRDIIWSLCATLIIFSVLSLLYLVSRWLRRKSNDLLQSWYPVIMPGVVLCLPVIILYISLRLILTGIVPYPPILTFLHHLFVGLFVACFICLLYALYIKKIFNKQALNIYKVIATFSLPLYLFYWNYLSHGVSDVAWSRPHFSFTTGLLSQIVYFIVMARILMITITQNTRSLSAEAALLFCYKCCWLCFVATCFFSGQVLIKMYGDALELNLLYQIFGVLVINIILCDIALFLFSLKPIQDKLLPFFKKRISALIVAIYVAIVLIALAGYHIAALYIVFNCMITMMIILIVMDVFHCLSDFYHKLSTYDQVLSAKLRQLMGVGSHRKLVEFYAPMMVGYLAICVMSVLAVTGVWRLIYARFVIRDMFINIYNGINFFGGIIYPLSFFRSILVFCVWVMISNMMITSLVSKRTLFTTPHLRLKVISLLHVTAFMIGLILALRINNVDLRAFIVVAGALSVGIGFGFQRFASDMLSGWFILLNKPVKIGDSIKILSAGIVVEGIVKNVGILSTQLRTFTHSDVFIPNSLFTTNSVLNLTFQDNKLFCIKVPVLFDESVDTHVAQQILMSVALKNPDIKQDAPDAPEIFLSANGLVLSCVILNVEQTSEIVSALAYNIEQAFKDNNVPIKLGDI